MDGGPQTRSTDKQNKTRHTKCTTTHLDITAGHRVHISVSGPGNQQKRFHINFIKQRINNHLEDQGFIRDSQDEKLQLW